MASLGMLGPHYAGWGRGCELAQVWITLPGRDARCFAVDDHPFENGVVCVWNGRLRKKAAEFCSFSLPRKPRKAFAGAISNTKKKVRGELNLRAGIHTQCTKILRCVLSTSSVLLL